MLCVQIPPKLHKKPYYSIMVAAIKWCKMPFMYSISK